MVDSFKAVDGIDLPMVKDRSACDLDDSSKHALKDGFWVKCDKKEADIFCCFNEKDTMIHIGRVMLNKALHAAGDVTRGQVTVWPWRMVERVYKKVECYKLNRDLLCQK